MKRFMAILMALMALSFTVSAVNLNGTWINEDPNTRGITKLVINKQDSRVHAWGQCHPHDCDWGKVRFNRTSRGILASWRQPGIGHKVILAEKINSRRIKVTAKLLYCDRRGDKTKIYYFRKAPSHSGVSGFLERFTGNWKNSDPNTRGITRISIFPRNGGLYIHAWGKCHPRDCDWGEVRVRRSGNSLTAEWHQGFADREMIIRGFNPRRSGKYTRLEVHIVTFYHDNRGIKTRTYRFIRR